MPYDPDKAGTPQSVNGRFAAAFLGVSLGTLRLMRDRGVIPARKIPCRSARGGFTWRYFLLDLQSYMQDTRNRNRCIVWDYKRDKQFPVSLVAALVGVNEDSIRTARLNKRLKDYTADSIRAYIIRVNKKRMFCEATAKLWERIRDLTTQRNRQTKRIEELKKFNRDSTKCPTCHRREKRRVNEARRRAKARV